MAPATHAQRLEIVESELTRLDSRIVQAVTVAMAALEQRLATQFTYGLEQTTEQLRAELLKHKETSPENREETPPNSGYSENGLSSWRMKKLDLPTFDGVNPDGWILRAERFFHFYRLGEEDKLEAAVVALDGDALLLYQWEHRRRPVDEVG